MADYQENRVNYGSATRAGAEYDAGLRSYMLGIYNYMALALAVTGVAALGNRIFCGEQSGSCTGNLCKPASLCNHVCAACVSSW